MKIKHSRDYVYFEAFFKACYQVALPRTYGIQVTLKYENTE